MDEEWRKAPKKICDKNESVSYPKWSTGAVRQGKGKEDTRESGVATNPKYDEDKENHT